MPVQTDVPIGQGAYSEWALWGSAGSKPQAVQSNDGDASVIYAASGGRGFWDTYTFPPLSGITDPVTAASVGAVVREYTHGAGHLFYMMWANSFVVDIPAGIATADLVHYAGGYTTITRAAAGGDLALAQVNSHHGVAFSGAGGPSNKAEFWVTYIYRTVDFGYDAPGGAGEQFAQFVGSLVGAFIGGNLLREDMARLAAFMKRRTGSWLKPSEYDEAWRGWRGQKRMVLVG